MTTKFKKHDPVVVHAPSSSFHLEVGKITHTAIGRVDGVIDHYVCFGANGDSDGGWFYEDELEHYFNGVERMIACL